MDTATFVLKSILNYLTFQKGSSHTDDISASGLQETFMHSHFCHLEGSLVGEHLAWPRCQGEFRAPQERIFCTAATTAIFIVKNISANFVCNEPERRRGNERSYVVHHTVPLVYNEYHGCLKLISN